MTASDAWTRLGAVAPADLTNATLELVIVALIRIPGGLGKFAWSETCVDRAPNVPLHARKDVD